MAQGTRSKDKSLNDSVERCLTPDENDEVQKRITIAERERQIKIRAEALNQKEIEVNKKLEQLEKSQLGSRNLEETLSELRRETASMHNMAEKMQRLRNDVNDIRNRIQNPPILNRDPEPLNSTPCHTPYVPINPPTSPEQSPIRLKDIVETIPRYDGQKMSVFQFSKICERALEITPPHQESFLVQLITNKLTGHAAVAVDGISFTKVSHLLRKLKQIFGPDKSLNQYKGELGNAYMKTNESLFDYISRIKELRSAIIDGEYELYGTLNDRIIDLVDNEVLTSFINGLPSDLLVRVRLEGYCDLEEAFTKAIQCSKILETEGGRRKIPNPQRSLNTTTRRDMQSPYYRTPQDLPQGTLPNTILKRPLSPFIQPLIPGQPGPNTPIPSWCKYCKNQGHLIADCRKLKYRNSLSNRPTLQAVDQSQTHANTGNAMREPGPSDVHRDASIQGRRTPTVTFQNPPTQTT